MNGKYIGFDELKTNSVTGVNLMNNGNRVVLNFFNETPYPSEQFEIEVSDNRIVSTTDNPTQFVLCRKYVCSIELDKNNLKDLIQFIQNNIENTGGNSNE